MNLVHTTYEVTTPLSPLEAMDRIARRLADSNAQFQSLGTSIVSAQPPDGLIMATLLGIGGWFILAKYAADIWCEKRFAILWRLFNQSRFRRLDSHENERSFAVLPPSSTRYISTDIWGLQRGSSRLARDSTAASKR